MREISSFTHSPSLPYCKSVRIRFFFLFVSHFKLQLYTTINRRIRAVFFSCLCVYIYISLCCRLIQTILPKFSAFSLLFASELYLLLLLLFSSARLSKWKWRKVLGKNKPSMSFFQSLSLSLLLALFSFDCSEMIKKSNILLFLICTRL
jgi:hypothetical protein